MNARHLTLIILSALSLFAGGAYAAGRYQQTEGQKSLVWNNNPRRGVTATWTGEQDDDGYASGYGTLTWYKVRLRFETGSNLPIEKRIAVSHYSGKMVKGKLNGPIATVDARGNTFHATFAKGVKESEWLTGPVPSAKSKREEPAQTETAAASETAVPPPAEGPRPMPSLAPSPASSPVVDHAVKEPVSAPPPPLEKPAQPDDSLRSLAMPPSSLRTDHSAESSLQPATTPTSSSPAPDAAATAAPTP